MSSARRISAALLLVVSIATFSYAQPQPAPSATGAASAFPWEGEVTGTNVRVRSGAGTDWYATTKVNTGDHVLVVGEQHGWYEICSLPRSFSYIDMSDVERVAGTQTAKVKRDRAFVRAGSELAQSKSTTQAMLNQGAIVEILGEVDGFFKIKPPVGAHLFVSKDYVRPVAPNLRTGMAERYKAAMGYERETAAKTPPSVQPQNRPASGAPVNQPAAQPTNAANAKPTQPSMSGIQPMGAGTTQVPEGADAEDDDSGEVIGMEGADPSENEAEDIQDAPLEVKPSIQALKNGGDDANTRSDVPAAPVTPSSGRYQALLTAAESDLNAMMLLPLPDRDIETLIKRYEEIATQTEERVPSEYANIRITQLKGMADLRKIRAEASAEATELDAFSARMTSERMRIMKANVEKATEKFDFVGQLLKSHAFAPEKRRYRLVDPKRQTTIAYVDIPRDVTENVEFMIGRTVGIKVAGRRYSQAARIPIAVAATITDLTPPVDMGSGTPTSKTENVPVREVMPPPLEDDEGFDGDPSVPPAGPQATKPKTDAKPLASGTGKDGDSPAP